VVYKQLDGVSLVATTFNKVNMHTFSVYVYNAVLLAYNFLYNAVLRLDEE